jgi:hypothetical protein
LDPPGEDLSADFVELILEGRSEERSQAIVFLARPWEVLQERGADDFPLLASSVFESGLDEVKNLPDGWIRGHVLEALEHLSCYVAHKHVRQEAIVIVDVLLQLRHKFREAETERTNERCLVSSHGLPSRAFSKSCGVIAQRSA